jgi:lysophospholipase L1-like esterase
LTGYEVNAAIARAPWKRFVALGDSITEGYGMDAVEGIESIPWAERVANALSVAHEDFTFSNLAYRSLVARQIRERQLERALAFHPDLVAIAAGPNDLLEADFNRDGIERELDALFAPIAATGAMIFTFTYMRITGSGLLPADGALWLADRMQILHDATHAVADRYGAMLIDLWNHPESTDPGFYSKDLRHSNARGQLYVAEMTLEHLARHVVELEPTTHPLDA